MGFQVVLPLWDTLEIGSVFAQSFEVSEVARE